MVTLMAPTKLTTVTSDLLSAAYFEDIFGWVRNSHRAVKGLGSIEDVRQRSIAGSSTFGEERGGVRLGRSESGDLWNGKPPFDLGHSCLN